MSQNLFVPWWRGFKVYWAYWHYHSYWNPLRIPTPEFTDIIGWERIIRTPLFSIRIAKSARSCYMDGYESGISISWFPTRWSFRIKEGELLYRHEWKWISFIPEMAIRGLR